MHGVLFIFINFPSLVSCYRFVLYYEDQQGLERSICLEFREIEPKRYKISIIELRSKQGPEERAFRLDRLEESCKSFQGKGLLDIMGTSRNTTVAQ